MPSVLGDLSGDDPIRCGSCIDFCDDVGGKHTNPPVNGLNVETVGVIEPLFKIVQKYNVAKEGRSVLRADTSYVDNPQELWLDEASISNAFRNPFGDRSDAVDPVDLLGKLDHPLNEASVKLLRVFVVTFTALSVKRIPKYGTIGARQEIVKVAFVCNVFQGYVGDAAQLLTVLSPS